METALLNYFVLDNELRGTCDFNPYLLQKGKLVYEVVRVIDGKPLFLKEHIERFYQSARLCRVSFPFERGSLVKRIKALVEANALKQGNIEFLFHLDETGKERFMAWVRPFFYPSQKQYESGVPVGIMHAVRKQPNAKAFNRTLRKEADNEIKKQKVFEVLLTDETGHITEGSRSNIFFVLNEKLFTPPVTKVLPGVTRSKILSLCENLTVEVEETDISLSTAGHFSSAFLSGTSLNILPVSQLAGIRFDVNNSLMRKLTEEFDLMIKRYLRDFSFDKL